MSTPSILIVEDDEAVRGELAELLVALGAAVICASNGAEALAQCDGQRFDLVLCDYKLEAESGLDVLRTLAALPSAPERHRLFLMTAHLDLTLEGQGDVMIGMGGLLRKPVSIGDLRIIVAAAGESGGHRC